MSQAQVTIARNVTRKGSASKAKQATSASAIKFAITDFARPSAGNLLIAHTAAFLGLSGMANEQAFPKAQAQKIIGARAVQYHLGNGNFEATDKGLILTEKGFLFFATRQADLELLAAYELVMTTGKHAPTVIVKQDESRFAV